MQTIVEHVKIHVNGIMDMLRRANTVMSILDVVAARFGTHDASVSYSAQFID